jgi:transcriptional regulator GlxA family with amidase domain
MDMALALIERLLGAEAAEQVAIGTEYTRHRDADRDPFVQQLNSLAGMLG